MEIVPKAFQDVAVEHNLYRDVITVQCRKTKLELEITGIDLMNCEIIPPKPGTVSFHLWILKHYLGHCYIVRKKK